MILSWISAVINWLKVSTSVWVSKIKHTVVRVVLSISILALLLWISIFLYGTFYYIYMPSISHMKPVHLHFRSASTQDDKYASFPEADVSLVSIDKDQLMVRGQPYIICLQLDMPESPVNQKLGMFMVALQFYSRKDEPLQYSQRSVLLRYKSTMLQTMETLVYSPMLLTGAREQKQTLIVEFFNRYLEDAYHPATKAKIIIESQKVQIYSASLKIYAHFTGLRFIMFNWPILSAIGGVGTNLLFLIAVVMLSWYRFLWVRQIDRPVVVHVQSKHGRSLDERRKSLRAVLKKERTEVRTISSSQSCPVLEPETVPDDFEVIDKKLERHDSEDKTLFILGEEDDEGPENDTENVLPETSNQEMQLRRRFDKKITDEIKKAELS
ncbi:seipin-like [Tubulanus polymorphus]|uniref:seipin-like n=1 Tax=Tubulanus polymorphus TaxID=672921 RepID=UPI003DA35D4B